MSVLEVRGLNVWFDLPDGRRLHAVRGLDFGLDRRDRLGLVGESGCGKSTALLAIMGLLPSNATLAGQVLLDGQDIMVGGEHSVRPHRWRDIAMVFQGNMNAFNPVQTVGAQIVEPMELHGTALGASARMRAGELLEMVGMEASTVHRYPHELSGGMRQRAAMAMALACGPKVLLADEPTTAVDVVVQAQILKLLVQLAEDIGLALVLVTHDLAVVGQVCQRAATMYAGEIVETGPVETVYRAPAHPYTAMLLAATPTLRENNPLTSIAGSPPRLDAVQRGCPFEPRCDRSLPSCATMHPAWREMADGHRAACHLYDPMSGGARAEGPLVGVTGGPRRRPSDSAAARRATAGNVGHPSHKLVLQIEDLVVEYPRQRTVTQVMRRAAMPPARAVDGLSLSVAEGEMVALVGQSGCGKTTTALAALGMLDRASGTVLVEGRDISGLRQGELRRLRRRIQMVFQDPYESLDPRFRVHDTVAEPLLIHGEGGTRGQRRERVREALSRVDLSPPDLFLDRYPHELSGGQRQRLAIAASLMLRPTLLIADEPVSMLDVSVRAGILSLLDDLRRNEGMAVLMITHDLSTAAHYADRIAVMHQGRIIEEGPAHLIVSRPQHPHSNTLLAAVPSRFPAGS